MVQEELGEGRVSLRFSVSVLLRVCWRLSPSVRLLRSVRGWPELRHLCSCFILFMAVMAWYHLCHLLLAKIPFIQVVWRL